MRQDKNYTNQLLLNSRHFSTSKYGSTIKQLTRGGKSPKKLLKNKVYTIGRIISTLTYDKLEINNI